MCQTPSKCTNKVWIRAHAASYKPDKKGTKTKIGKWLIFVGRKNIDAVWNKIKKSVENNSLGISAKVSTRDSSESSYVICVYTKDWTDRKDVMRVRKELRKLGITNKIPYKSDADTLKGKYYEEGKKVSKYYE